MMIKLTNAHDGHLGNPIYINTDQISAVYPQNNTDGGGQMTIIYGGQTGITWIVEEGVEQVVRMIGSYKMKSCGCK